MLFRQLLDFETSTLTYLLADSETGEAVLIDPVREQVARDQQLLAELELQLLFVLETHVHADHVTGGGMLREALGCELVLGQRAGVLTADRRVGSGDLIQFGAHVLEARETPGHTDGCVSYVCHEAGMAFTGDALLIRGCGRTDFQQGDARTLYRSVHERILGLPADTLLYPGHDYRGRLVSTVAEELKFNPRLGAARTAEEFVSIMENLRLAYPKRIDEAVPANMASGTTEPEAATPSAEPRDAWAPVLRTPSGVPVVSVEWLAARPEDVRVLDVREHLEFCGPLGHLEGAELVPLAELAAAAREWPREEPVVTVCAYGTRSGKAAIALGELGFLHVASLHGGMTRWAEQGHPAIGVLGDRPREDAETFIGLGI